MYRTIRLSRTQSARLLEQAPQPLCHKALTAGRRRLLASTTRQLFGLRRGLLRLLLVGATLGSVLAPIGMLLIREAFAGPGRQGVLPGAELWFPFLKGDAVSFSGYAITNHGLFATDLEFQAVAADGTLQSYPDNPSRQNLSSQQQVARTASEIFDLNVTNPRDGWIRLLPERSSVASFFQFGQVGEDGLVSQLDGAVAVTELSTALYFTRIISGPSSYFSLEGTQDAVQTLYLANPNTQAVEVQLEIFGPAGQQLGLQQRNLPSAGCLAETLDSLFGLGPINDGLIRITSSSLGIAAFQTIQLKDTILGFNALPENASLNSFSAQLAHGESGDSRISTSLKIANVSESPVALIITALREDGSVLNVAPNLVLGPNQVLQRDIGDLFSLGPATAPQIDGSIRVEASGPGVLGDVIFGDADFARYAAALPPQTRLLTRAVFGQVANLRTGSAAEQLFTGLAFHNPDLETARLTIRVFTEAGQESGSTSIDLLSGTRRSDLLADLVPESAGQVRGYITIESTQPIVAQQLFGNFTLDFLSAVPPTILE